MKLPNSQNLLIASLLGLSALFAGSYPLVKAQSVKNIPFEVCFNSDSFVRPSREEYTKFIKQDEYLSYRVNTYLGNISNLFDNYNDYWSADILFFSSYYGLSGGKDMEIFSGIEYIRRRDKNAGLGIGRCWDRFAETNGYGKPNSHNEVRLIKYKLRQIRWVNNKYIFVVEPRKTGLQILHFRQAGQDLANPIEVIDTKGRFLGKCQSTCQLKK
ncbi:MAG: hypothetical protein IM504_20125 [Microcystis sp. M038S2]|jgi:hypothetical protein|uniref:hypothetical protein n=1 Tax=unclassified Microcystis TaxID=2643300 RepID=UPI001194D9AD|nr:MULTISPECIES: hypothetical protein [unclassified Microcystis]TRU59209.1 MAG: hypothetical protein EWV56_12750 [Microcystis aeruginosa Ma_QC_C_20070823_S13D]TRU60805.1 MAG: hypothetical protein EWV48_12185 [Microcystis aeruginosa Ma_QC_C_20070823_S13]MCA2682782.1 hypothetical protein [Microcystis sp. M046S2]MCA2707041.1 hypothetical protein [Microcystis sp. M038S2]MCA2949492.1 hypothetical protein [Microcystis sp. M109S1]